ncbi:MAG: zf-HC2 domain-containing protein [Armatimonadetes bacterium]|nr:zf-HC2 domain-containing protein [Armatimonadota bacterium]
MTEVHETGAAAACETRRACLTALLDGELPPHDATEVWAHLAECPACRRAWEELAAVRDLAAQWTMGDTPDLWPAVQAQIEPEPWETVMAELRQLRAETQALWGEVAQLRRELAARPTPPEASSRLLFPNGPAAPAGRRLV